MECEWKHSFHTSKKQARSHEVNVRGALAYREIARGHSAMTTFSKVMNMPALAARRIVTKIQNERLLPIVKRLANDSTMLSF